MAKKTAKKRSAAPKLIGFIGVGVMGGPMARRLGERGYPLIVLDPNPAALKPLIKLGARIAKSPRDMADRAKIVFASVPTPQVLREVALGDNGVIRGRAIKTFIDLSTTGTKVEKEIAKALAARGIDMIDAPISGGAGGAAKGTLAVMVAGRARAIAEVRELFDIFGKVFVAGAQPGQAQMLKLINNLLSSTAIVITAEALVAGVKAGLDPDLMLAAINSGSGRNSSTADKFPNCVLTRTFDFGFPISGALKDVSLAVEECQALGLPMTVGSAVRQMWQYAYAQGEGKRDMMSLVTYIERWAGVEVRGKAAKPRKQRD